MNTPVLRVEDLTVRFTRRNMDVAAVNGVDFSLQAGETLTILGESGSGKSVSLKALMGLLPAYASVSGKVWLNGQEILGLPAAALAKLRGGAVSMIFQEPMAALDPVYTIGQQIAETIVQHEGCDNRTAMKQALGLLEQVKIPSAERRLKNFPHEMSGGMRQRAMIALALACKPSVLLAEPTTALDVTVQIQILLLLRQLQEELGMAIVFVTHETGTTREVMRHPMHPYTQGLLSSTVHGGMRGRALETIPGSPPTWRNCLRDARSHRGAGMRSRRAGGTGYRWLRPKPERWRGASGPRSWWAFSRLMGSRGQPGRDAD